MSEITTLRQIDLFTASAPAGLELGPAEALDNARRFLADGGARREHEHGGSRDKHAHLPASPGGPEIYALCPGCQVHPDGGIFPAAELARAEGCPTGRRVSDTHAELVGGEKCRGAEREGSAHPGSAGRSSSAHFSPPVSRRGLMSTLTALVAPCSIIANALSPRRALDDVVRRLRRGWYFHRRRAICRRRLSRIASDPSWTS